MGNSRTSGGRARAQSSASDVRAVHELFVAGQVDATYLDTSPLRRVVAESWQRSLATGVDPDLDGARSGRATLTWSSCAPRIHWPPPCPSSAGSWSRTPPRPVWWWP